MAVDSCQSYIGRALAEPDTRFAAVYKSNRISIILSHHHFSIFWQHFVTLNTKEFNIDFHFWKINKTRLDRARYKFDMYFLDDWNEYESKLIRLGPIMISIGPSRGANAESALVIFYKM
jgi:hypothetical protein